MQFSPLNTSYCGRDLDVEVDQTSHKLGSPPRFLRRRQCYKLPEDQGSSPAVKLHTTNVFHVYFTDFQKKMLCTI